MRRVGPLCLRARTRGDMARRGLTHVWPSSAIPAPPCCCRRLLRLVLRLHVGHQPPARRRLLLLLLFPAPGLTQHSPHSLFLLRCPFLPPADSVVFVFRASSCTYSQSSARKKTPTPGGYRPTASRWHLRRARARRSALLPGCRDGGVRGVANACRALNAHAPFCVSRSALPCSRSAIAHLPSRAVEFC